jgi:prepilin-type processing-associated H-X9-DG protein
MSSYPAVAGDVDLMTLTSNAWPGQVADESVVTTAKLHGPFCLNSATRLDDLRDGTSQTILVGERRRLPIPSGFDIDHQNALPTFATSTVGGFTFWMGNSTDFFVVAYMQQVGTAMAAINTPLTEPKYQQLFSSTHSGGATFVFGDGHVKFINETIDLVTYKALCTIAGSEVVDAKEYE